MRVTGKECKKEYYAQEIKGADNHSEKGMIFEFPIRVTANNKTIEFNNGSEWLLTDDNGNIFKCKNLYEYFDVVGK